MVSRLRVLLVALAAFALNSPSVVAQFRPEIPAAEFSRIVREFSEADGFFRSENLVSNETGYLHIVDKLRKVAGTGGAYLGVGPEQNFTYIAKIRPEIAFILDIRRQAVVQHLMYKAMFHLAPTRTRFLSLLLSRPADESTAPGAHATIDELVTYFSGVDASDAAYAENLRRIRHQIQEKSGVTLSEADSGYLERILAAFKGDGLNIQYRSGTYGGYGVRFGTFPTLREILQAQDLSGAQGSFLADWKDYEFVRELQERNQVIPVCGDFAGSHALASIAAYLRKNDYTLSAFYTSNVEQYLFMGGTFSAFAENVKRLPISEKTVFVRAFPNMRDSHPARMPGHRLTTLLQLVSAFLKDFEAGIYDSYWTLVTTNYISADLPTDAGLRSPSPR